MCDVMGSQVSSFFSYPCQRTLYREVLTFSSPVWLRKSSRIDTICLDIHCYDPSVWCENAFQTGSKYEVTVCTVSFCSAYAKFLFHVSVFLSDPPLSVVLSDVMGVEVFFSTRTVSDSCTVPSFCVSLLPFPFLFFDITFSHENQIFFRLTQW